MSENQENRNSLNFTAMPRVGFVQALGMKAGNFVDSVTSAYRRAVGLTREDKVNFLCQKAKKAELAGDYENARIVYMSLMAYEPENAELRYLSARNCEKLDMYEEAVEYYREAIKLKADFPEAYMGLGLLLGKLDFNEDAIKFLERAVKLCPDDCEAHFRLGLCYDKEKKYKKAVSSFKKAIKIDPWHARAYKSMGFTYETMGKHDESVKCFKKALELET